MSVIKIQVHALRMYIKHNNNIHLYDHTIHVHYTKCLHITYVYTQNYKLQTLAYLCCDYLYYQQSLQVL